MAVFVLERGEGMERITSRKNPLITHIRTLLKDRSYRREKGEFVCDGVKLLKEALLWNAEITTVLWSEEPSVRVDCRAQYAVSEELLGYVSPLKSAAGVVFSVRIKQWDVVAPGRTLVVETIQDPGNMGTILRTANALGMDTVILTGDCADVYNPKTVRATMGAVFRQRFYEMDRQTMRDYLTAHGIRLYGAALSDTSRDIRQLSLERVAVAIGSEGRGLSDALLAMCDGELIIPMSEQCESLNAAVAAAVIMWEISR